MIASLFVDETGVYSGLENVDAWPASRDARLYAGPHPVVAHPPCQLWGPFAAVNYKRWGGEHNRPGNDGGCFESALRCVRSFGGVLEHPGSSRAWDRFGLARPVPGAGWTGGPDEWVCEVFQSAYGHLARKRTWLFAVCKGRKPPELDWRCIDGTHQIGFHDQRGKEKNKPTISGKAASATPVRFRDALIGIAEFSGSLG